MGCHRNNVNTRVSYEGKRYWKLTFSSALIFSLKMFPLITSRDFLLPLFVFQFVWELFHFEMMG